MVLPDRMGAKPKPSLAKRTALYVALFSIGALAIPVVMSLVLVSLAERPTAEPIDSAVVDSALIPSIIGRPKPFNLPPRKGSKARPPRGNETTPEEEPSEPEP